jgi:hypothetical protein
MPSSAIYAILSACCVKKPKWKPLKTVISVIVSCVRNSMKWIQRLNAISTQTTREAELHLVPRFKNTWRSAATAPYYFMMLYEAQELDITNSCSIVTT